MMRSLRVALVALVLALGGALCLSGTDGVAVAKPQPTPVVSPAYPVRSVPFTVTGRLRTHVVRAVQLQLLVGKRWTRIASGKTLATGRYSMSATSASPISTLRIVAVKVKIGKKTYAKVTSRSSRVHTVAVSPAVPMVDELYTVSDRLSPSVARPAVLQRRSGSKWATIASSTTSKAGYFTFTVPHAATSTDLRVVAKKIKIKKKTYKKVVTKIARLAAVGQSAAIYAPNQGDANTKLTVTSTFTPARIGRAVDLESLVNGQWVNKGRGFTDASGHVSIDVTPTAAGVNSYRSVAAAWKGAPAMTTPTVAVTVIPPVSLATGVLPDGVVGEAYTVGLVGTDGTGPYTWTSTALPAGLTLNSTTGAITGTPTAASAPSVTFTISDNHTKTATRALTLTVTPAVSVTTTTLVSGVVNEPYTASLAATSGTSPYTWTSTALPAGLTLNSSTGVITGTPTTASTPGITFTVTDNHTKTALKVLSITINPVGPVVGVGTASLANGVVGEAYNATLTPLGGTAPYTWSASGLPDGLSVEAATGVISGTPTAFGQSEVALTITDGNLMTGSTVLILLVDPALWVTIGEQAGSLEPGGPSVTVAFTVTNRGESALTLDGGVDVTLASPEGVPWSAPAGCEERAYQLAGWLTNGAGTIDAGASVEGVVTVVMDNLPSDQNACKGVPVPLHVRVSAT